MDGVLDGAVGLVGVRAVGELAEGDVGAELDEVALDLAGLDAPELELAEAGGVDDVAARSRGGSARRWWSCASPWTSSRRPRGRGGSGPAGSRSGASSCRRRSGPRRPSVPCASSARSRSIPRPSAAEVSERLVAELGVQADDPLVERQVDEVGLVQDDHRPDAADLGRDQVAVDQRELQPRLLEGRDDEDLVDVGDEDVLAAAVAAGDRPAAGLDLLDQPFLAAAVAGPEPDAVADGDDVAGVDRQGLEDAADVAGVLAAVVGLDDREQAVDPDDPARGGRRPRSTERRRRGRRSASPCRRGRPASGTSVDDRPVPRQVPLGADALADDGLGLRRGRPARYRRVRSLARVRFWRFFLNATRTFFFFATLAAPRRC